MENAQQAAMLGKMFEEGIHLKNIYGEDNVFDFIIGNPILEPPLGFKKSLKRLVNSDTPSIHSYSPNTGLWETKSAVAVHISKEQGINALTGQEIIMTCGAAGGLNVIFKTILNPGDEIITFAPYFIDYRHYTENHGGVLKVLNSKDDFTLDIDLLAKSISEKTKIVLINSPNNPTGQIYSQSSLEKVGSLLAKKGQEFKKTIYLVSDEAYRKVVFSDVSIPSIFNIYDESIITSSYSKDLSIPGERIGFVAINPLSKNKSDLLTGMTIANRILGFINAPVLMQRVVAVTQGLSSEMSAYEKKRDLLCAGLEEAGYDFFIPRGAFYLFPKSPIPDETEFIEALKKELILVLPGRSFGRSGYFRIAFCVSDSIIKGSISGFKKVLKKFNH